MNSVDNVFAPDVAAILEGLRAEIRSRAATTAQADDDPVARELRQCVEQLEIARVISAHWPLEEKNLIQKIQALFNKIVRRLLRWYINPIVEQQNAFNDVSARTLRRLIAANAELQAQLQTLQAGQSNPPPAEPPSPPPEPTTDTATLQALIGERGRQEPPAALSDLDLRALQPRLQEKAQVNAHWELAGPSRFEQLRGALQRLIRRSLRWYINPIVEQQNAYNAALAAALGAMLAADAESRARLALLRAEQLRHR
jgi:predicted nucleic acid-binding protein